MYLVGNRLGVAVNNVFLLALKPKNPPKKTWNFQFILIEGYYSCDFHILLL